MPGSAPAEVWEAVSERVQVLSLGGEEVEAVGPDTTALLAALHPLHRRMEELKPLRDPEAAVAGLPEETWLAAAALAARLGPSRRWAPGCG